MTPPRVIRIAIWFACTKHISMYCCGIKLAGQVSLWF